MGLTTLSLVTTSHPARDKSKRQPELRKPRRAAEEWSECEQPRAQNWFCRLLARPVLTLWGWRGQLLGRR